MPDAADIANEYVEQTTEDSVAARVRFEGASRSHCVECDEEIPPLRQESLPGVQRCVHCQAVLEHPGR